MSRESAYCWRPIYVRHILIYNEGQVQVQISIKNTFQYHVDLLSGTLAAAERLRGGDGNAADNLDIDAVVQPPVNDARNNRAIARAAQRNAAPDNDPGDDDSDDDDNDDWEPGNNNPGNPGGNNYNPGGNNDANNGDGADGKHNPGDHGPPRRDKRFDGPGDPDDDPDDSSDVRVFLFVCFVTWLV